jgi:hypothetical protein
MEGYILVNDSRKDMRPGVSEGEIEGGVNFYNRELCVKEEEKM